MDTWPVLRDGKGARWVTAEYAGGLLRRAELAEKRLEEADLRNKLLRKTVETHQERIGVLEEALGQIVAKGRDGFFASCPAGMSLGDWCESFVEIARAALASEGTPEEAQDA